MVSSIAIGLGFSAWRGSGEPTKMSKIDALALRGVVVAALGPSQAPYEVRGSSGQRPEPPSLDYIVTWHFIR